MLLYWWQKRSPNDRKCRREKCRKYAMSEKSSWSGVMSYCRRHPVMSERGHVVRTQNWREWLSARQSETYSCHWPNPERQGSLRTWALRRRCHRQKASVSGPQCTIARRQGVFGQRQSPYWQSEPRKHESRHFGDQWCSNDSNDGGLCDSVSRAVKDLPEGRRTIVFNNSLYFNYPFLSSNFILKSHMSFLNSFDYLHLNFTWSPHYRQCTLNAVSAKMMT